MRHKLCFISFIILLLSACQQDPSQGITPPAIPPAPTQFVMALPTLVEIVQIESTIAPATTTPIFLPSATLLPTHTSQPIPTSTSLPTVTSVPPTTVPASPTSVTIPTQTVPPPTATPSPTPSVTPLPTATSESEALAIHHFSMEEVALPDGSREFTFQWDTSGGTDVMILMGNSIRFAYFERVPASGTTTIKAEGTVVHKPTMSLRVSNGSESVSEGLQSVWECRHSYFFKPIEAGNYCPQSDVNSTVSAIQYFEHGFMIWLPSNNGGANIFAFVYATGNNPPYLYSENDTWADGQPESDPTIVSPDGLFQPIRGFGKVWRNNSVVRDQLGWALAPEMQYTAQHQYESRESLPGVGYITTDTGRIIQTFSPGSWQWVDD